MGVFHSHPSGENLIDTCSFIQAPSKKDLDIINGEEAGDGKGKSEGIGYVFGLRSHLVYIYRKDGIQATIPFKFFLSKMVKK